MENYVDNQGFVRLKKSHELLHRIIGKRQYSEELGYPYSNCVVRHRDGNKTNNKPSNLELLSPKIIEDFKKKIDFDKEDTRDEIFNKYIKKFGIKYDRENYQNLEAVLQRKKFPVSFNLEEMNRLKKELKFEADYS